MAVGTHSEASGDIRIRIVREGGGAGHIDMVSVGGNPPKKVIWPKEKIALRKLAKRDFDVTECSAKGIDLVFAGSKLKDKSLVLVGRIESKDISKEAFKFPPSNLYKKINKSSEFYSYKLNSKTFQINVDEDLKGINQEEPFFQEFSRSGTGHPSGFTLSLIHI